MEKIISEFAKQFNTGFKVGKNIKIRGNFQGVCICGMGGSALPGTLLLSWIKKTKIPVILHRDYGLPANITKNWLVLVVSYSGNTEETISSLKEAIRKKINCAAITSGGKLESMAKRFKISCALIPSGIPPRMALGYQFSALTAILLKNGLIDFNEKELLEIEKNISTENLKKEGKVLAQKIKGKIPVIYSSNQFKALARIWKISFNENSKTPAFWNYFPELNHNEMVGFTKNHLKPSLLSSFYFIMLKSPNDIPENRKRIDLTAKILRKQNIKGKVLSLSGKNLFVQMVSSIILANWTSYFLALKYKINPMPVDLVEEFKNRMKTKS